MQCTDAFDIGRELFTPFRHFDKLRLFLRSNPCGSKRLQSRLERVNLERH